MVNAPPCKTCGCIPSVIFRKSKIDPRTKVRVYARRCFCIPIYPCDCLIN